MINLGPTFELSLFILVVYILYGAISRISLLRRRTWLQRIRGALPPVKWPQAERILGWKMFKEDIAALNGKYYLRQGHARFENLGVNTYECVSLGRKVIVTREPENLKTIQATDSKIWYIAEARHKGFRPLLGNGMSYRLVRRSHS